MENTPLPTLGSLCDPNAFTAPLELGQMDRALALQQLRSILQIRYAEECIGDAVAAGNVRCPCHLAIGQEAIAVGVSAKLTKQDKVFGGHRSHAHFLALGGSVYRLFAEILGRETGCSKGMGGSMHLFDAANGFVGSVPIVAATVPLAVGAALAAKKDGKNAVGVAYFGDGAAEEGCVHESMNFASAYRLPVLFVCENNLFSSHLHIDLRQPDSSIARFAAAHRMPYRVVDGNDVVAVARATQELLVASRQGQGPGFLEAVTYRWRGHVGAREDTDVGVKRNTDLVLWKQRDPLRRLADALIADGTLNQSEFIALQESVRTEVAMAWAEAEKAPFPPAENTLSMVYSPVREAAVHPPTGANGLPETMQDAGV